MSVLSLDDAKAHLNIKDAVTDEKVQTFIDAAESYIASQIGPLEPTTKTVRIHPSNGVALLPDWPIVSLTSVTPDDAAALTVGDFDITNGLLSYTSGQALTTGGYAVVYEAGYATLPADLLLAVKEMLRHLWTSQRGGTVRPGAQQDTTMPGYLVPNMVASLIAPYRVPGIA